MSRAIFKALVKEYLDNGGSKSFLSTLPVGYSLQTEAKLRVALRVLKQQNTLRAQANSIRTPPNDTNSGQTAPSVEKKTTFKDFITDYPVVLHTTYLQRKQKFLAACSLKVRLNALAPTEEDKAFSLQRQILSCFAIVDAANEKLEYWQKHKKILEDDASEDFSMLSQAQLVQRRNTLRSNASNRSKTILKMEKQLTAAPANKKLRLQDKLFKKRNELRAIENQIKQLGAMIK